MFKKTPAVSANAGGSAIEIAGLDICAAGVPQNSRHAKGRRRCTKDLDVLLLKKVAADGAHVARDGEGQEKYKMLALALNGNPLLTMGTDWKNTKDRLLLLIKKHREDYNRNKRSFGTEK